MPRQERGREEEPVEGRSISEWIEIFGKMPRQIRFYPGISPSMTAEYGESYGISLPEDYLEFMSLTNGAEILNSRISIWKIPLSVDENIPEWRSIEYFNRPDIRGRIPFAENCLLIAGNDLGDYVGITNEKPGFPYKYISPDMNDCWYYSDLSSWLEEIWKEWILG